MYDIYPFLKDELFCLFAHSHLFFFDNLHFDGDTKCGLANSISFSLSSNRFVKWMTMGMYVYVCMFACVYVCM